MNEQDLRTRCQEFMDELAGHGHPVMVIVVAGENTIVSGVNFGMHDHDAKVLVSGFGVTLGDRTFEELSKETKARHGLKYEGIEQTLEVAQPQQEVINGHD